MGKVVLNIFLLTFISWAVIAYDVSIHGSLESSRTGRYLKEAGLLIYIKPYYNIIEEQTVSLYRWGKKNFPSQEYNTLKNKTIEISKDVGNSVSHYQTLMFNWIKEKISPEFSEKILKFLTDSYNFMINSSNAVSNYLFQVGESLKNWLVENVTKDWLTWENLEKSYFEFAQSVQLYLSKVYCWVNRKVSCLISA